MHRNTCVFVLTIAILLTVGLVLVSPVLAAAPSPPSNLNVQPQGLPSSNIIVVWQAPPQPVDYYNIYKSFNGPITSISSQNLADFVSAATTTYTDTDTIPGETFFYQVTAVNSSGEESLLATPILSDNATVPGKLFPHRGESFTTTGGFCRFCHRVHKAQGSKKVLRKKLIEEVEVCYTCHDGTGSDFNIMSQFNIPTSAHNNVLQGNISANIKCLNCHHPHGRPPNPRMTHELEQNLCFSCHRTGGTNGEGVVYSTAPKIKDVFDPQNGWVVGTGGLIRNSTNNGTSWAAQTSNTSNTLNSVHFVEAPFNLATNLSVQPKRIGWAVGAGGTILTMTNSGSTWATQTSGTSNALNSVFFVNNDAGWAVGAVGTIRNTTNGGTNWGGQTSGTTVILRGVHFSNTNNGWVVGDGGVIRNTTNGGTNWNAQTSTTTANLNGVYFVNSQLGFAVGNAGVILRTTNGGDPWEALTSGTTQNLLAVYFADKNRGWAVGAGGTILRTINGGTNWTNQSSGTTQTLNGVFFTDGYMGWVAGAGGVIRRTVNGSTWDVITSGTTTALNDIYFPDKINMYAGRIYAHPVETFSERHMTVQDENADTNGDGQYGDGYSTMTERHVECTDCHNQHQARAIDSNYDESNMGPLDGASGVTVNNGTNPGVPSSYGFTLAATRQYQVCFKCHSSFNPTWNQTPFYDNGWEEIPYPNDYRLPRGDKALEFNTNNSAYHPVEGPGRNTSGKLNNQLISPLSINSRIMCSNCHNNPDPTGARGPHASTYQSIRKANYLTNIQDLSNNTYNSNNFALCFTCHNESKLTARRIDEGSSTNFYDTVTNRSLHWIHLVDRISKSNATCKNCHFNPHSNQAAPNTQYRIVSGTYAGLYTTPPKQVPTRLINFSLDVGTIQNGLPEWSYDPATRQRRCFLACHGYAMDGNDKHKYLPEQNGDVPAP